MFEGVLHGGQYVEVLKMREVDEDLMKVNSVWRWVTKREMKCPDGRRSLNMSGGVRPIERSRVQMEEDMSGGVCHQSHKESR